MALALKAKLLRSSPVISWTFPQKNPILKTDRAIIDRLRLMIATYCDLPTFVICFRVK